MHPIGALAHLDLARAVFCKMTMSRPKRPSGFSEPLEKRRPRNPRPEKTQGGVRKVKVDVTVLSFLKKETLPETTSAEIMVRAVV